MKGGENRFFTLNNSVASNWIFLLGIVVELAFSGSSVNEGYYYPDRLLLMPFDEVCLLDYLISYYGASIPMGSNQTRRQ